MNSTLFDFVSIFSSFYQVCSWVLVLLIDFWVFAHRWYAFSNVWIREQFLHLQQQNQIYRYLLTLDHLPLILKNLMMVCGFLIICQHQIFHTLKSVIENSRWGCGSPRTTNQPRWSNWHLPVLFSKSQSAIYHKLYLFPWNSYLSLIYLDSKTFATIFARRSKSWLSCLAWTLWCRKSLIGCFCGWRCSYFPSQSHQLYQKCPLRW